MVPSSLPGRLEGRNRGLSVPPVTFPLVDTALTLPLPSALAATQPGFSALTNLFPGRCVEDMSRV